MKAVIQTTNFYLREFRPEDAREIYLLNLDPDVIKYTGDPAFTTIEEAADFIANYDQYKINGFGRWAVIMKSNNEFVGWCGLRKISATNEIDLGFRFMKQHWNKGFAKETGRACIEYGFNKLGMETIIGRAMIDNIGSIKVLEKIGMVFSRAENCANSPGVIYKIEKANY